jgi:hypothetical protein
MGRHQSVQHRPGDRPESTKKSPTHLVTMAQLLHYRPIVFWSAVATIPLVITALAVSILLDPAFVAGQAPTPEASSSPSASTSVVATSPNAWLQIGSLGAIALSCAAGTLFISHRLNRPQKPKKLQKLPAPHLSQRSQLAKRSTPTQPTLPVRPHTLPPRLKPSSPLAASLSAATGASPGSRATQSIAREPIARESMREPIAKEPIVTVVPAEQSHPLDWDENSLVNAMDLRKRRPLSSWL